MFCLIYVIGGILIFEVTFYGSRGSTPTACPDNLRYGGNTTCIALRAGEQLLIVDCGTGLLPLYEQLFKPGTFSGADVFLTHTHWDHIQGFAFFSPFFSPACTFRFYGEARGGRTLREQFSDAFHPPVFPLSLTQFSGSLDFRDITCGDVIQAGAVRVETFRLTHPDVCTGYRFTYQDKSVCIVSDYEHGGEEPSAAVLGTDLLIYDAQYTADEYPSKKGWGHSTWEEGCRLAGLCGAKRLILTHHDPARGDGALNKMQSELRARRADALFAWDGLSVTL